MRRLASILAVTAIATTLFASLPAEAQQQHTTPADSVIPLSIISKSFVAIPLKVNNAGPYKFIIDTASTSSVIEPSLAKTLNLKESNSINSITATQNISLPTTQVESLELGTNTFLNIQFVVASIPSNIQTSGARGILGSNVLEQTSFLLDYDSRTLTLNHSNDLVTKLDGTPTPVTNAHGLTIITIRLAKGSQTLNMVLDSAVSNVIFFNKPENLFDAFIKKDAGATTASSYSNSQQIRMISLSSLQVGDQEFSDLRAGLIDNPPIMPEPVKNGLLPTSLFKSVYFSHSRHFVILNPKRRS